MGDAPVPTLAQPAKPKRLRSKTYDHPILLRLSLEVNKSGNICVAAGTPVFTSSKGELLVPDLITHVKTRLVSQSFLGMIVTCLVEAEDYVNQLKILPFAFKERTFLFKPRNPSALELCMLLSMLENLKNPTLKFIMSILNRARFIYNKTLSEDATLFCYSIEKLGSTLIWYYDLDPANEQIINTPLLTYKFYKCIEESSEEAQNLLRPIYLESEKMNVPYDELQRPDTVYKYNMFYYDTIFTKHLRNEKVVEIYRDVCLNHSARAHVFLK